MKQKNIMVYEFTRDVIDGIVELDGWLMEEFDDFSLLSFEYGDPFVFVITTDISNNDNKYIIGHLEGDNDE